VDGHVVDLVMASTHDMMCGHVVRFQRDIVDGFPDPGTVASHLSMTREAAARALHRFSRKAHDAPRISSTMAKG